jgi:midasin (ATPase involved in ribosome maturation)
MATTLRFNSPELVSKHKENIAASLAHRLEVARNAHNTHLVLQLEKEQQALLKESQPAVVSALSNLAQSVQTTLASWGKAIAQPQKLSVEKVVGDDGNIWWRAYDYRTGKTLYAEAEWEVIAWIEENSAGQ